METQEMALEDHPFFRQRLDHLESRNPAELLNHLEQGTLLDHLRQKTLEAVQARQQLMSQKNPLSQDKADELVGNQVVADPDEETTVNGAQQVKLNGLLKKFKADLPNVQPTYQSQSETTS